MSFVRSLAKLRNRQPSTVVAGQRADWLVVGLGNPGAQYAKTRHNIGFMCTNRVAHRFGVRFRSSSRDRADMASVIIGGQPVVLAQPQTYMNESGNAVSRLRKRFQLDPAHIILVYDDIDLPFATIRVRQGGTSGGQRGAQSVVEALQTTEVPRIRVGIGRGSGPAKDHVLAEFSGDERQQLPLVCDRVADIVEAMVTDGVVATMNRFNGLAQEVTAS